MNTRKSKFLILGSLLVAGLGITGCHEDEIKMPYDPSKVDSYNMSFVASRTPKAITGTDAVTVKTRGLVLNDEGDDVTATWKEGDQVTVWNLSKKNYMLGTLKAKSDGVTSYLAGTVNAPVEIGDELNLTLNAGADVLGEQKGTLQFLAENLDYDAATVHVKGFGADGSILLQESAAIFNQRKNAIIRLTLYDKNNGRRIMPSNVTIKTDDVLPGFRIVELSGLTEDTYKANGYTGEKGEGVLYAMVAPFTEKHLVVTATVGNQTYYGTSDEMSLADGDFKSVVLSLGPPVSLSELSGDYKATDGDLLMGTLQNNVKITVADGATITLNNAVINEKGKNKEAEYAGLTCLGNADIILEGGNYVSGFEYNYPGIFVPEGKTLTITGTGQLEVQSNGYAAGIGASRSDNCGNIVIKGGSIVAKTGDYSAGIGGSFTKSCGNIYIGGTAVVDAEVNRWGTGIGCGMDARCGTITITGQANVTAIGGMQAAAIGSALAITGESICGLITISGEAKVNALGGQQGAGIGSGYGNDLGNGNHRSSVAAIAINGNPVIEVKAGENAAAIGTGHGEKSESSCGPIFIEGGDIQADSYESVGATIGSGVKGKVGDITITDGIKCVEAYTGRPDGVPIGKGKDDQSGDIKVLIDGSTVTGPDWTGSDMPTLKLLKDDGGTRWVLKKK